MTIYLSVIIAFFIFTSSIAATNEAPVSPPITNNSGPTLVPTNSVPVSDCQFLTSCEACSKSWSCVWCYDEKNHSNPLPSRCVEGTLLGPKSQCTNWRYRQCLWDGYWTMVASFTIAAIICFLAVLITICACCCKKPKRYTNIQEMEPFLQPAREYYDGESEYQESAGEFRESEISLEKKRSQLYKDYEESAKFDTNPFSY